MDVAQLRREVENGRLSMSALLEHLERQEQIIQRLTATVQQLQHRDQLQQDTIQRLTAENQDLRQRLEHYEPGGPPQRGPRAETQPHSGAYSLDAEEQRRRKKHRRRRRRSPGRRPTELKFAAAQRYEDIYPDGVAHAECRLVRERAIWRLENGRAVRVGYRIFALPGGEEPRIPGVTPRCEYGLEILVVLAYLVYLIGISLDKACAVLAFFCQLPLTKSQADALLRQLAKHWEREFETLCALLAHAAVVHLDETGWKIGSAGCALWTFASKLLRVFLFGCHKDAATLDTMLPPDVFTGVGVSDDAAVYQNRFVKGQKCWAHLLRKAIRLALLCPEHEPYQQFLDDLLALYQDAKRAAADGRLGDAGRRRRVAELERRLYELCEPYLVDLPEDALPHARDFNNLVYELEALLLEEELFTFVVVPGVEPTNNLAERLQRPAALDRKAGRTSKTAAGARRRSIVVSVLESLRVNLEHFSFATVVAEAQRWLHEGMSLFARQAAALLDSQPACQPNTS